ncbi:pogo transposable element [Penicillium herquei]|nr:pogo transposable element [Penicillium herquei]
MGLCHNEICGPTEDDTSPTVESQSRTSQLGFYHSLHLQERRFLTPYLITKGKKSADFEKVSRVFLGSNPNGWADEFDFTKWYEYFETKTRGDSNRKSRPWRLLLVEGHKSPVTEKCFVRALKKRIIIFSYPRHKANQLDRFSCGVLDFLEKRFVEWLTPRWEERSTRGEEIVEIESLDLAATVSWLTVAGKGNSALKVERETEIRAAWVKCNQNWTLGGDLSISKEIKPTVVKAKKWDKGISEDHVEGERTRSSNESSYATRLRIPPPFKYRLLNQAPLRQLPSM